MYIRFNSSCCKTFLVYLICLSVLFRPTFANASTVGGWSMSNPVAKGASTVYTGIKNITLNGADYVKKGTAIVTPTATGVAKVLAKGVAGVALSVAVEQLLGAVDWVLDPANNQIVYTKPQDPTKVPPDSLVCWTWTGGTCESLDSVVRKIIATNMPGWTLKSYNCPGVITATPGTRLNCTAVLTYPGYEDRNYPASPLAVTNPNYDPTAEPESERKTLPLDVVAQKVISNAESGDTNAQVATTAAAADIVAEAEKDEAKAPPIVQQLEASAQTKPADEAAADKANEATGEQTKNPDKPDTTDLKLTFPIFCNWAPTVCQAAQTVITFPTTLTEWWETGKEKAESWAISISQAWTEAKEWSKEEEKPKEDDPQQIQEPDLNISVTNYIQFGSQCPQDRQIPLSMGGQTLNLVISYQPLCIVAEQFRPAVILMAFLAGAFIITNTGRRAETGD